MSEQRGANRRGFIICSRFAQEEDGSSPHHNINNNNNKIANKSIYAAADSANTTHHIKHVPGKTFNLRVVGLIKSQIEYEIGGEPVRTTIKEKEFMDTVTELTDGRTGVKILKVNKKDKYHIEVTRFLENDEIVMEQTVIFSDGKKEKACQRFKRE